MRRCTNLDLSGTDITDGSVPLLVTLTQLEWPNIHGTRITDKGKEELEEALQDCEISK